MLLAAVSGISCSKVHLAVGVICGVAYRQQLRLPGMTGCAKSTVSGFMPSLAARVLPLYTFAGTGRFKGVKVNLIRPVFCGEV
jgi:hypothetical protein